MVWPQWVDVDGALDESMLVDFLVSSSEALRFDPSACVGRLFAWPARKCDFVFVCKCLCAFGLLFSLFDVYRLYAV